MRVVAVDRFEYASKLRLPGDEFDTDNDEHARLLVLAKRVAIVTMPDPPFTAPYKTRDLKADGAGERKPNPYRDKYRNRYRHRQMQADE